MSRAAVLICDFGGVLTTPLARSFQAWSEAAGVPLSELGAALADAREATGAHPLHELECGRMTEDDFLALLSRGLSERLGRPIAMDGFADAYFAHLDPNEELLARLRGWRDGGMRLALCTNNVREWEPRWHAMLPPVDELFETVVDSAFAGVRKPDPEIYRLVLERMGGVAAEACVFVDDFEVNCDAARELGMRAVQFIDNAQAMPEIEAALAGAG